MTHRNMFNANNRDVFLSYSSDDYEYVEKIKERHNSGMINIKTAPHDISKGTDGFEEIRNTIRQSDVFAVLYTENTQKSEYIDQEIGIARAYKIPILPISLCDCVNPTGFIKTITAVKCSKDLSSDDLDKITTEIMRIVFNFNLSDIIVRLSYDLEPSSIYRLMWLLSDAMYKKQPLSGDDVDRLASVYFMRKYDLPEIHDQFKSIINYNKDRLNSDFKKIFNAIKSE